MSEEIPRILLPEGQSTGNFKLVHKDDGSRFWEEIAKGPRVCGWHGTACNKKHCAWCGKEYSNRTKHLKECDDYKREAAIWKRGRNRHFANWDGDMRLSGRRRSGGLDS